MSNTKGPWSSLNLTVVLLIALVVAILAPRLRATSAMPVMAAESAGSKYDTPNTEGKVPGDPEQSLAILRRLYPVILKYRTRHGGALPPSSTELVADMQETRGTADVYGCTPSDFATPDSQYQGGGGHASGDARTVVVHFPWMISNKRPDGSAVGGPVPPGTRELFAWSDLHFHPNYRNRGAGSTASPVGYLTVLWSDGTAELLPWTDLMLVPTGPGEWRDAVRGQAGLPADAIPWSTIGTGGRPRAS